MAEIKHVHRLAGLEGEIDALRSEWRAGAKHTVVWRAADREDSQAAARRLRDVQGETTLEYLAIGGDDAETIERDTVEIVEVRLEEGRVCATLRLNAKEG